jgi:hypothetical protein
VINEHAFSLSDTKNVSLSRACCYAGPTNSLVNLSGGTGEKIKGGPSKHSSVHKFGNSHNVSNIQLLFMTYIVLNYATTINK